VQPSQFARRDSSRGPHSDGSNVRSLLSRTQPMDVVFILALVGLYAATHWLILAVARLRSSE